MVTKNDPSPNPNLRHSTGPVKRPDKCLGAWANVNATVAGRTVPLALILTLVLVYHGLELNGKGQLLHLAWWSYPSQRGCNPSFGCFRGNFTLLSALTLTSTFATAPWIRIEHCKFEKRDDLIRLQVVCSPKTAKLAGKGALNHLVLFQSSLFNCTKSTATFDTTRWV